MNKFRKTTSRLGQENPKKEVEPIAPNSEAESKQNILYKNTSTGKKKKMKKKLSPLPYEAGECSSSVSRRPGHPHSTRWSCERAKTKLNMHILHSTLFYVLDSISTSPYYAPDATTEKVRDKNKNKNKNIGCRDKNSSSY